MTDLFASELRKRLYVLVQDYPGLHLRELARRLGVKVRAVEYHAEALVAGRIIEERRDGAYQRLFPNQQELPLTELEREWLGVLRKPIPLALVLALLDAPEGLAHTELCRRTGTSKANATHHLKRLVDTGLVEWDGPYRLADPQRTRDLLRSHKPVPELRQRFADAWASIYRM
jgi:predicted transcriptional regulator